MENHYTTKEACRLSGATIPQLEHFVQTGVVVPARQSHTRRVSRLFTIRDVAEITVATQLLHQGVPVRAIRHVTASLRGALRGAPGELKRNVLVIECGEHSAEFGPFVARAYLTPEGVSAWLREGHSGIVVNIPAILERLERATGEAFGGELARDCA